MLHTVLHGLGILVLCGKLWLFGDIGWSLPKYQPKPPQYCMWDCLVLIIEKFMFKSWGISQIFLSGVPPFTSVLSVSKLPKILLWPKLACQILAFPWDIWSKIWVSHSETFAHVMKLWVLG